MKIIAEYYKRNGWDDEKGTLVKRIELPYKSGVIYYDPSVLNDPDIDEGVYIYKNYLP